MKRILIAVIFFAFSTAALAQKPAAPPSAPPTPQQLAAPPLTQTQIDAAWKDLEIAQLRLQLVVQQALGPMGEDVYYDFMQKKFFRRTAAPVTKSTPSPGESPAKR